MAKRGDPRSSAAYTRKARAYIDARRTVEVTCALCNEPVNMAAPSTTASGPTIEHRIPVRKLQRMAQTRAELLALTCDEQWWAIAHRKCQDKQGGASTKAATKSREW